MEEDDLVSTLRVACVLDPAIDRTETPMKTYAETRAPSLVVTKPGAHAKWAKIRGLTTSEMIACEAMPSDAAKARMAFVFACTEVENFSSPGVSLLPTRPHQRLSGKETRIWGDVELERLMSELGMVYIYEIGSVAYSRANLGNAFGGGACFTPPQYLPREPE